MKIIRVTSCQDCPFHGTCKAWKALTRKQRVQLTIGNSTPQTFILAKCELEGDPLIEGEV